MRRTPTAIPEVDATRCTVALSFHGHPFAISWDSLPVPIGVPGSWWTARPNVLHPRCFSSRSKSSCAKGQTPRRSSRSLRASLCGSFPQRHVKFHRSPPFELQIHDGYEFDVRTQPAAAARPKRNQTRPDGFTHASTCSLSTEATSPNAW